MLKFFKLFISSILAGACISLGGFLYIILTSFALKELGCFVFGIGLFLICFFQLHLYTGRIGFAFEQKKFTYIIDLIIILVGNLVSAILLGFLCNLLFAQNFSIINNAITKIANNRMIGLTETWYKSFIMALFCGVLVFLAVYCFKTIKSFFFKTFYLILCVGIFVGCSFEHCIANAFYYSFASAWSINLILNIIIGIIGNSVGSLLTWILVKKVGIA